VESGNELLALYNASIQRSKEANQLGSDGRFLADQYAEVMELCMQLLLIKDAAAISPQSVNQISGTFQLLEKQLEALQKSSVEKKQHGGARVGAGKKKIGLPKPVTITLPPEDWKAIDARIQNKEFPSRADYFRKLHERFKEDQEGNR
jgi:hypothetical protein